MWTKRHHLQLLKELLISQMMLFFMKLLIHHDDVISHDICFLHFLDILSYVFFKAVSPRGIQSSYIFNSVYFINYIFASEGLTICTHMTSVSQDLTSDRKKMSRPP